MCSDKISCTARGKSDKKIEKNNKTKEHPRKKQEQKYE